jgi:peptidyl-prolyl cis-trans isomerase C
MCLRATTSHAVQAQAFKELAMTTTIFDNAPIAKVNGIWLHQVAQELSPEELRQRACSELLRQAAVAQGLLPEGDQIPVDGVLGEAASSAIEALLEKNLAVPEPSVDVCRRHHAANQAIYCTGERVQVRHILFAVTQGVDVVALRNRAETTLLDVRCHDGKNEEDIFAKSARTLSNCPSGADGGALSWLTPFDCAPEFAKELFGHAEVGVLPRLMHTRFGLHVVEVLSREAGVAQPFESVRGAVAMALRQKAYVTALRQYLQLLAGQAVIVGVDLDTSSTQLVQ